MLGLSKYLCFIREGLIGNWGIRDITVISTVHWQLIVIAREDSHVMFFIYPINHTLFAFQYVKNKLFVLVLFVRWTWEDYVKRNVPKVTKKPQSSVEITKSTDCWCGRRRNNERKEETGKWLAFIRYSISCMTNFFNNKIKLYRDCFVTSSFKHLYVCFYFSHP